MQRAKLRLYAEIIFYLLVLVLLQKKQTVGADHQHHTLRREPREAEAVAFHLPEYPRLCAVGKAQLVTFFHVSHKSELSVFFSEYRYASYLKAVVVQHQREFADIPHIELFALQSQIAVIDV